MKIDKYDFVEQMTACKFRLSQDGEFQITKDHDNDEPFTILDSWQGYYRYITQAAVTSGCYGLYKKALARSRKDKDARYGKVLVNGKMVSKQLITDLRLGRNKLFPFDDEPYYTTPDAFSEYADWAEEVLGEWGFSDEYSTCDECGKAIRTSPDSYSWSPDYIEIDDIGRIHIDCVDLDDLMEQFKNQPTKAMSETVADRLTQENKLVVLDRDFESGLHRGMDDDPMKVYQAFKQAGIDIWFRYESSQFYIKFQVLVLPEDEEKAGALVDHINAYQGWSNAEETARALSTGKSTEHIRVTTTTIPQDQLGDYLKKMHDKQSDDEEA